MVCLRNATRHVVGNDGDDRTALYGLKHPVHRHRPSESRIGRIELERLDDALLRHQLNEVSGHDIRVRRELARGRSEGQRHLEQPADARLEDLDLHRRAVRRQPLRHD